MTRTKRYSSASSLLSTTKSTRVCSSLSCSQTTLLKAEVTRSSTSIRQKLENKNTTLSTTWSLKVWTMALLIMMAHRLILLAPLQRPQNERCLAGRRICTSLRTSKSGRKHVRHYRQVQIDSHQEVAMSSSKICLMYPTSSVFNLHCLCLTLRTTLDTLF